MPRIGKGVRKYLFDEPVTVLTRSKTKSGWWLVRDSRGHEREALIYNLHDEPKPVVKDSDAWRRAHSTQRRVSKRLSKKQLDALRLAARAETAAVGGKLICSYGNEFFMAGRTDGDGTAERSTLKSLGNVGFLMYRPGITGRGEYAISAAGKQYLAKFDG